MAVTARSVWKTDLNEMRWRPTNVLAWMVLVGDDIPDDDGAEAELEKGKSEEADYLCSSMDRGRSAA